MSAETVGPDAQELLSLALRACDAADEVLMSGHRARGSVDLRTWSKSSATDLATEMDVAAERAILDIVLGARPGDAVLAEESGVGGSVSSSSQGAAQVRWVVDPLDGTINYIYGLPHWAVSIAAEIEGQAVVGVVSIPVLGERFTAVRGTGAWLHAGDAAPQRLVVGAPPEPSHALVATGFGYAEQRRQEQARVVSALLPAVRDIRRLGAAAIDLCHVACGRVDAYYERGLQPWDLAAGGLIAQEAGVRVEGWNQARAGEELVIAAAPGLFEQMHALLAGANDDTSGGRLAD